MAQSQFGKEVRAEAKAIRKAQQQDRNTWLDIGFQVIAAIIVLVLAAHEVSRHISMQGRYGNLLGGAAAVCGLLYLMVAPIFRGR